MTRNMVRAIGLAVVCLISYSNALNGTFHYDDFHSIVDNRAIRSLANIPQFFTDPAAFSADAEKAMYRPLLLVSYAFNHALGRDNAGGYLAVNLMIHLLCSLLVWRLGYLLLKDADQALVAGLLFAVHPLGSEPVNYISSRSESLAGLFYLAAFFAHIRAAENARWHWLGWGAFGLGLLCKSIVITLVLNLWFYDRWKNSNVGCKTLEKNRQAKNSKLQSLKPYLPYLLIGLGYLALILQNRFLTGSLGQPVRAWDMQFFTQVKAPVYYLKLLFFPWGLNVEHQFLEAVGWTSGAVLAALLVGLSLTWVGGVQGHKTLAGFALAWSLTVLLPTLVMPLNMLVNERRLYLVVAAFAWFGASLYTSRYRTGFGIMVLILGALTVGRNRVWSDEVSLWLDAKDKAPLMYRVHANLGKALQLNGRNEAALAAYTKAIELEPGNGEAYNNIATLYHLRGELAEAIHWYGQALERYPRHAGMRQNLADAYYGMGVFDQAIDWYQQALEMDPGDGQIWNNYGQTLYAAGQYKTAETAFLKALDIIPEQPEIYNNLGNIYSRYSDYPRSIEMYKKALDCEPEDVASVWANLADAYRQAGLTVQARQAITSAMQTAPKSPHLMLLAGRIERQGGDFSKAFGWLTEALSHDAANVRLWVEMAEIEVERGNGEAALTHFVQATKIDLTYSRAWYGLARLKETQKDSAGALEAYRRFSETWTADDMRALEVRRKIKALEAGG